MGKQKDIRMMTVYSYARFVAYTENFKLVPDILESFDVEDSRIFTFRLRKGHKWSDGHPFTSKDIEYAWKDVISEPEFNGGSLQANLVVNGKGPKFEVVDDFTVRFTWDEANPEFLPALAAPRPIFLALPAHYMKAFHKNHQDPAKLEELIKQANAKNWRGLHIRGGLVAHERSALLQQNESQHSFGGGLLPGLRRALPLPPKLPGDARGLSLSSVRDGTAAVGAHASNHVRAAAKQCKGVAYRHPLFLGVAQRGFRLVDSLREPELRVSENRWVSDAPGQPCGAGYCGPVVSLQGLTAKLRRRHR